MSAEAPSAFGVKPGREARSSALPRLDIALMLVLFAIAIVPRAAWAAYRDRGPQVISDPALYLMYGDQIANGRGYRTLEGVKTAYFPIGYPATLGALRKAGDIFGWGRSIFAVKMMNGMFGAITVLLVFLLASRMFDRRIAFLAGLLEAIFPSQVYYSGAILTEPEFTMLFVAALLVLLWEPWSRDGMSWRRLAGGGLLLGAATMVRGILLPFPVLLFAVWFFHLRSRRRAALQALVVFAGMCVFVVPWSIRNTVVMGELTGPSKNVGDDLCIGNFYGAQGAFTLRGKCFEGYEGLPWQQVELRRNRRGLRIAVVDVITHPARMPRLLAQKAYWLFYRDDDGLKASMDFGDNVYLPAYLREVLAFAANAFYYAVGAVAILGALAFACARDVRRPMIVVTLLYILAIPLAFFGDSRFHYPAIPLVVVVAAATVIAIWDARDTRQPSGSRRDELPA